MKQLLFDSNLLIYYLNDALNPEAEEWLKVQFCAESYISVVTRIELLGWPQAKPDDLRRAEILLELFTEITIDEDVVQSCIRIRQQRSVKIPDALIAATALTHHLTLVTRNTRDFTNIDSLQLHNPIAEFS